MRGNRKVKIMSLALVISVAAVFVCVLEAKKKTR